LSFFSNLFNIHVCSDLSNVHYSSSVESPAGWGAAVSSGKEELTACSARVQEYFKRAGHARAIVVYSVRSGLALAECLQDVPLQRQGCLNYFGHYGRLLIPQKIFI